MSKPAAQPGLSAFACKFCKKRKVKCDRTLPNCSICQKTQQECDYPSEAARPGPKLGTTRTKRPRSVSGDKQRERRPTVGVSDAAEPGGSVDSRAEPEAAVSLLSSAGEAGISPCPTFGSPDQGQNETYPLTPVTTPLDVRTLAYIMHPSHDAAAIAMDSPQNRELPSTSKSDAGFGNLNLVAQACALLKIPTNTLQPYLDLYFDNMTSFSLFHRPSFAAKLYAIDSVTQLAALLASIFAFSARFRAVSDQGSGFNDGLGQPLPPKHFEDMSQRYVDEALTEYPDRSPPLCILQALTLLTFSQLIKGVRGAAWRRLGVCVRVAYELDLHHVDLDNTPEQQNLDVWCVLEERRRAWWAIWEMDVFASMIRRCPTALDWTDNETRLPVSDEDWFNRKFSRSCFLEKKPMDRLKELQRCGSLSSKAWFIVLDSFMREGHILSKFRSPRPGGGTTPASTWVSPGESSKDDTESLAILANALRCFSMALPKHLRHRDGFLTFSANDPAERQLHSAKYSIHVTAQLTRMMIHHQDAYRGAQQDLHLTGLGGEMNQGTEAAEEDELFSLRLGPARQGLQQFIEAADELLRIVSWSSEEQVRYVNPFLASTIWYGAVVHLGWKVLAPPSTNLDWIESKFAVLHMILMEFSDFWDLPKTLQENLASVEGKLRLFKRPKARRVSSSYQSNRVGRDRNQSVDVRNATANLQNRSSRDLQNGSQLAAARTVFPPNSAYDPESLPTCDQNDRQATDSQQFLPTGLNMGHDGMTNGAENGAQDGRQGSIKDANITGSMGDVSIKNGSVNDDQYVFDESCLPGTDIGSAGGSYADQIANSYQPRGLWDDLRWDLDFAIDPRSLFRGIMDYNN